MTDEVVRFTTHSQLITTAWAAMWRPASGSSFRALGCQPDPEEPWRPLIRIASGHTPVQAYGALVQMTGRPWWVVIREGCLLEIPSPEWRDLVRMVPKLRMIADLLWQRAEPIWAGAADDPERSQALWMAITAAHGDEIAVSRIA